MRIFFERDGEIIALLDDRNGGWYSKLGTSNHRGKRVKGELVSEEWIDPGVRHAKLEQQIGIQPPTIFSDDLDNKHVCLNITDGSEELLINENS